MNIEHVLPSDIERRSFEIIAQELGERTFSPELEPIIKRVIHTTADFEYADSLCFSAGVVEKAKEALGRGVPIVTDTTMALSGINKPALSRAGSAGMCFIGDEDVAAAAKENGTTRSAASVDKAAKLCPNAIFAVGNAPTALLRICELAAAGRLQPSLVIGVPVGFVNVVQSKELLMATGLPYIVAQGRKGGSTVAAAICNALLYNLADSGLRRDASASS